MNKNGEMLEEVLNSEKEPNIKQKFRLSAADIEVKKAIAHFGIYVTTGSTVGTPNSYPCPNACATYNDFWRDFSYSSRRLCSWVGGMLQNPSHLAAQSW